MRKETWLNSGVLAVKYEVGWGVVLCPPEDVTEYVRLCGGNRVLEDVLVVIKLSSPLIVGCLAVGSDLGPGARDVWLCPTAGKVNKSTLILVSSLVSRLKSTYSKSNFIGIICSGSPWDLFVCNVRSRLSIFDSVRFGEFFNFSTWVGLDMEFADSDSSSLIG